MSHLDDLKTLGENEKESKEDEDEEEDLEEYENARKEYEKRKDELDIWGNPRECSFYKGNNSESQESDLSSLVFKGSSNDGSATAAATANDNYETESVDGNWYPKMSLDLNQIFQESEANYERALKLQERTGNSSVSFTFPLFGFSGTAEFKEFELSWNNDENFHYNLELEKELYDHIEKCCEGKFDRPEPRHLLFKDSEGLRLSSFMLDTNRSGATTILVTKQIIFLFYKDHKIEVSENSNDDKYNLNFLVMTDNKSKRVVMIDVSSHRLFTGSIEVVKFRNEGSLMQHASNVVQPLKKKYHFCQKRNLGTRLVCYIYQDLGSQTKAFVLVYWPKISSNSVLSFLS